MTNLKVTEAGHGQRLDVFLAAELGLTRSSVAKQLKTKATTVNGKVASVHQFLKTGDQIVYETAKPKESKKDANANLPKFKDILIKETPDWIVLNKPVGLLVHPDAHHEHGTLVDVLVKHDPAIGKLGEDPSRPGIVHRLDRDVSGLMVIPKTQDAFDDLKKQFAQHSTTKVYIALVYGTPPKDEGDIKFKIARSTTRARMAARPEHEEGGRAAWTHYRVIKKYQHATLLELQIFSGRTHQIRAHLHALRCPIIGDSLYIIKSFKPVPVSRLLLQSVGLKFKDPTTHEDVDFRIEPDPAFEQTVRDLKNLIER
ncbi:MAG: RluA family pseudouridine synthase [Patescibacteria group bacterium]|jgi:23S rRNA pseudouridine1911/1915/1917 synthase